MSFFVVALTVKPFRVAPVEPVDYLLGKTIYSFMKCLMFLIPLLSFLQHHEASNPI